MNLTSEQVEDLVEDIYCNGTDCKRLRKSRWSERLSAVTKIGDSMYRIEWDKGLTEVQDDYYPEQDAPEVFEHTVTRISTEFWTEEEIRNNPDGIIHV